MAAPEVVLFEINGTTMEHLSTPLQIDLGTYRGWGRDGDQPFHVEVDAIPLLTLAEEAARGARIYEFLSISRPGDIQSYLRVRPVALSSWLSALFENDPKVRFPEPNDCGEGYLPFIKFDGCFRWDGDDTVPEAQRWLMNRRTGDWNNLFTNLLEKISGLQLKLRQSSDPLVRGEVARLDARRHVRDYLPRVDRWCRAERVVPDKSDLPAPLLSVIASLIVRDTVRSVSCPLSDYWLWRSLIEEQLRRSAQSGRKPQAAFWLSGSDSGVGIAPYKDWGSGVHIPYEGACMADLFIQPGWRKSFPEADTEGGKLCDILYPAGRGFTKPQCHYLLTKKDLGELKCARRTEVGDGWILYESNAAYQPVRTDKEIANDDRDE